MQALHGQPLHEVSPPAPADAEVVRNIEVLAAFVAKNGAQFEQLARSKTVKDPKFEFLLDGSPPGSEAARAQAFYQWKKQRLEQRVFASDGSDDLQLKICAMVDDESNCSIPSADAHAMDNVKPLPPGTAEKKKSEGCTGGVQKAEVDDSTKKPGRPPHHRTRDDVKPSQSTASHKKKPELISSDRSKHPVDSMGKPHPPPHEATDNSKQPLPTFENKRTASTAPAPREDLTSRASQPVEGAKDAMPPLVSGDSQKRKLKIDEGVQKARSSKDDLRNSPGGPLGGAKAQGDAGMDQHGAELTEKLAKENHGLRLLKAALADYVKEALKPAWKEGNLSKEAFKSIVKKAVDKVVGSLQAHQIPKSQENVDQYMAQSQAKIAKLVQGYVDRLKKN